MGEDTDRTSIIRRFNEKKKNAEERLLNPLKEICVEIENLLYKLPTSTSGIVIDPYFDYVMKEYSLLADEIFLRESNISMELTRANEKLFPTEAESDGDLSIRVEYLWGNITPLNVMHVNEGVIDAPFQELYDVWSRIRADFDHMRSGYQKHLDKDQKEYAAIYTCWVGFKNKLAKIDA